MKKTLFGLNIPNFISISRIIMVVPLIILLTMDHQWSNVKFNELKIPFNYFIGLIIFIFASTTDWLDGFLARKYNLITSFGKFIDPIADKLLVNSVVVIFAAQGLIPVWVALVFILRDIIVDSIRMFLASENIVLAANNLGKLKTVFQMIGIPIVFLINNLTWSRTIDETNLIHLFYIPLYISVFFSALSGVVYLKNGWVHIAKSK